MPEKTCIKHYNVKHMVIWGTVLHMN